MALVGNRSILHKSPARYLNAGVATYRSNFSNPGMMRSADYERLASIPYGYGEKAWFLPKTAGGMSSINFSELSFSVSGAILGGITTTGTATLTFDVADAVGGLITSGSGSATISITTNAPLLTASINGSGSATITITVNNPILGAEANLSGSTVMTITGTLTPYAIGHMSGTTEEAGLTPSGIANAVWAKVIEAGFSAEEIIRIMAAQSAGSATGLESSNPQFVGLDGVTVRIDGNYVAGVRTIDNLNGV